QGQQQRARKQRRDHREGGIFRRRSYQDDDTVFHAGQQCVLLGLVEAVDLVEEEHGGNPAQIAVILGLFDDSPDILTPAVMAESSTNLRSVARAITWAMVVLPIPGGP